MKRFYFLTAFTLVIMTIMLFPRAWATISPEPPDRYSLHLVRRGDTLWGISKKYMPKVDPRIGVMWIRRANGMSDKYVIQPGDILNVPDPEGELEEPLGPEYSSEEAARKAQAAVERLLRQRERPASRAGHSPREMVMEATAFTAGYESTGKRPGDPGYGITYSGLPADRGVVAVDPAVIPLGTILWVEGYGYAVALDTGSAIKGNKVDVFFWDVSRAREWGRRQVRVRVIK